MDTLGRLGGLDLLWRKEIMVDLLSMSVHHILVVISEGLGEEVWCCTGFSGWPGVQNRHLSWCFQSLLASQASFPWVCIGDFSEVLFMNEK